jgi:hypothetical protein
MGITKARDLGTIASKNYSFPYLTPKLLLLLPESTQKSLI